MNTLNDLARQLGFGRLDATSAHLPVLVRTEDGTLHETTGIAEDADTAAGQAVLLTVKPYEPPVKLTLTTVERVLSRFSEHVDADQARTFLSALRTEALTAEATG